MIPFTEEHEMFRKAVRNFVEKEINPYADQWEQDEVAPLHDLFKKMGDLGFLGLSYPEEYGGANADIWFTVVLCEELGHAHCAGVPMAIMVQTDMATPALAKYGLARIEEVVSRTCDLAATPSCRLPSPSRTPAQTWRASARAPTGLATST
jgi:citronellyl-CoA dehydrogenase